MSNEPRRWKPEWQSATWLARSPAAAYRPQPPPPLIPYRLGPRARSGRRVDAHSPKRWQSQAFRDLSRNQHSPGGAHMSAMPGEFGFRQKVDHIAAHGSLPIEAIGFVENDLILFRRAIQSRSRANQGIDHIEIRVLAPLIVRNDDRWVRQLLAERKKQDFPLPHLTTLRTDRCANSFDSTMSSGS